jgi:hypothetical protein
MNTTEEKRTHINSLKRNWALNNPEKKKAASNRWASKNRDRVRRTTSAWNKAHAEEKRIEARNQRIREIKAQNCICPGCGKDKSYLKDEDLSMVFQKSHFHVRKCEHRDDGKYFWSCLDCNVGKQQARCGWWLGVGSFFQTCKENNIDG